MIRYPLAPLAEAVGVDTSRLARILSLSGSTWKEYRDHGVTEKVADRLAVKAGFHPYEIWPELADAALVECADDLCGERYVPDRRTQRYCSATCRKRAAKRRERATEAGKRRNRERRRRYYAENAAYERRRERAAYERRRAAA